jgi:hypothetical protein
MKKVLFKIEEKTNGHLDVSFSSQVTKAGVIAFISAVFVAIQHLH